MKIDKAKVKKLIGIVFYGISIYYFYNVIRGMDFNNFHSINNFRTYVTTIGLAVFHSILLVFIAYIYSFNLMSFSNESIRLKGLTKAATQYLLANVAKYVPGNVVHYVGRNALLSEIGYGHKQIAFISLFELILFGTTSFSIAILTSFDYLEQQLDLYMDMQAVYLLIFSIIIIGLISVAILLFHLKKNKENFLEEYSEFFSKKIITRVVLTFIFYSIYFILLSTTLLMVLYVVFGINFTFLISIKIIGLFIVSYFIGMVAPGVPGGIGVREAVAIGLISQYVNQDTLFVAVFLLRLITILGDVFSFIYGKYLDYCIKRRNL